MQKSEYHISKMDRPSVEDMVRLKLDGLDEFRKLEFDLDSRRHPGPGHEMRAEILQGNSEVFHNLIFEVNNYHRSECRKSMLNED